MSEPPNNQGFRIDSTGVVTVIDRVSIGSRGPRSWEPDFLAVLGTNFESSVIIIPKKQLKL